MFEMVMASFLKIWHIIPIVIGIILFRRFLNLKDQKRRIQINEENEKNGLSLELRVGKKYEDLGYEVSYCKIEDSKAHGIDMCCSKENKTLLIQCNKDTKSKSTSSEDIKKFVNDAMKYIKINSIDKKNVEFRYAILYPSILDKSALKILSDDSHNCKYIVL